MSRRTPRKPFTVEVLTRGGWATDTTTKRLRYARERCAWLARSPRRQAVARIVDADGRAVT